ncbi:hypothetical protein AVEN_12503-1 [Araneus ventricosus]|uniref:Uncharacterized protein n=1 Tax=Araneus ventricosus TaxID=182803 RepID=A0A4Y2LD34_ARAVE|nr:hypothetical protein AVEN_12503-1 [Araneus ventricosus]
MTVGRRFLTAADVKGVGLLYSCDSFVSRFLFLTRDTLLFLEVTRNTLVSRSYSRYSCFSELLVILPFFSKLLSILFWGRGGLAVRSRPRDRWIAGPKPDSTEDPPCMGPVARQIIRSGQTPSHWCGAEAWREGRQLRRHPRHLTAVQNYEVRP